jgi:hypothetical protein
MLEKTPLVESVGLGYQENKMIQASFCLPTRYLNTTWLTSSLSFDNI